MGGVLIRCKKKSSEAPQYDIMMHFWELRYVYYYLFILELQIIYPKSEKKTTMMMINKFRSNVLSSVYLSLL